VERLSVYDRWGGLVFLSREGGSGWDGRIRDQLAAEGVYMYVIEWLDAEGTTRVTYGELTLVR
jgi:gliding motility-associated-like protein